MFFQFRNISEAQTVLSMEAKEVTTSTLILGATEMIQTRIANSVWSNMTMTTTTQRARLVGRYTAAFAAEFQAWLGATHLFVRNEQARCVLAKNIRCEFDGDHIGLLYDFAQQFDTESPSSLDRYWISAYLGDVRRLFINSGGSSGLRGLAALTLLENTSLVFIPILEAAAARSGIAPHTYTQVHGRADIEHSQELLRALEAEQHEGYVRAQSDISTGISLASSLVLRVFANP